MERHTAGKCIKIKEELIFIFQTLYKREKITIEELGRIMDMILQTNCKGDLL